MKLMRCGNRGVERPAMMAEDGSIRDLSAHISDLTGVNIDSNSVDRLSDIDPMSLPQLPGDIRIGACLNNVGKFVCIGLNYSDHARETGVEPPEEPVVFMKATSAICGPNDDIIIPRNATKTDWEVELGVAICKRGRYISEQEAWDHIAGYMVINDLSEREHQLEGTGQWVKGKSADTFGPIGPYLVTKDEIADPHNLAMWLEVDGKRYQNGSTSTMIFRLPYLVAYLSNFMTLNPGDIISTGTPPGVGLGQKPEPVYLTAGQKIELEIEGLGRQTQRTVQWSRDEMV